jgi:hypothetical protein
MVALLRAVFAIMFVVACGSNKSTRPTGSDPEIAPGVSTDCYNKALDAYKACVAECKTAPDPANCCGSCDLTFATTFQNCCNDDCKVDDPPPSCADDSAPGCAGGAITHNQARPAWCDEPVESGRAAAKAHEPK